MPYVTLNREEFGVLGSAILAGYAAGVFADLAQTSRGFIEEAARFEPNLENHVVYQPFVDQYIRLFEVTKPIFDALAAAPEAEE